MLRIGLTGGIGSGKTTVGRLFAALGVPVLDADVIAHQLSQPGHAGYRAIKDHFGDAILTADGSLDRAKLRDVVFADPAQRQQLEALLHPLVFAALEQAAAELSTPYCILSIPLLLETHAEHRVDRILVVDVPEALQYQRVQQRDGLSSERIAQILAAQCSREQRMAMADDIVRNDGRVEDLEQQVAALHRRYLGLAARTVDSV